MLLVNDVLVRSVGCLALLSAHLGSVFSTPTPHRRSNLLWWQAYGDVSRCITESAVMLSYRVCAQGFDCVCRAGTAAIGRPDDTVGAVSAHSAP
ncbi:hypothetical protein I545_6607 [Mycobacterium kansasii 662]|uniref:Uncharacterized protein n=2 Tax=Mycobacterium kansasii TaxID=1768 RepID=A0A1V3WRY1_MYCKA|nr:hypothetical protein I545_6607 [Mycobacterium kansasii 662]EUA04136.1 hypothetical protein I547_2090 [Mycobacterium kansasii 824]KEP44459.1 hypothetical protein MKSMC1_04310 [Mycobacterium kansasii]OOK68789.1 hypothetical protein BZL30_6999 [Mycobacterium kansasii]OOK69713.1 hypothetical protein BZL29_6157 [Mycobacterium kansasii]